MQCACPEIGRCVEGSLVAMMTSSTSITVPTARVERIQCTIPTYMRCQATLQDDCRLYNGPNMHAKFRLSPVDADRRLCEEKIINGSRNLLTRVVTHSTEVTVDLPQNLLSDTTYKMTAIPANDVGLNDDVRLTKDTTFRTKPSGIVARLRDEQTLEIGIIFSFVVVISSKLVLVL